MATKQVKVDIDVKSGSVKIAVKVFVGVGDVPTVDVGVCV